MNHYLKLFSFALFIALSMAACTNTTTNGDAALQKNAQAFLDSFSTQYLKVYTKYSEAQWASNTKIVEGDSTNAVAEQKAGKEYSDFTGSNSIVDRVQSFLKEKENLTPLQVKQFEAILYQAGNYTQKAADAVKERIKAETDQTAKLYGFNYTIDGKPVTTNNIDSILRVETNVAKRLSAWNTSKEVGKNLKTGLVHLRDLRNKVVQSLGYHDFFTNKP
jgi:peptidyl-dipeptidase A